MILTTISTTAGANQGHQSFEETNGNLPPLQKLTRNCHPNLLIWSSHISAIDARGLSKSDINLIAISDGMRSLKNVPSALTLLNIKKALQDMSGSITQNGLKTRTIRQSKKRVRFAKPSYRDPTMWNVTWKKFTGALRGREVQGDRLLPERLGWKSCIFSFYCFFFFSLSLSLSFLCTFLYCLFHVHSSTFNICISEA